MYKILDCTLRDGGYYNNWDFDIKLVNEYLKSMSKLGIDLVELGFRTVNTEKYFGPLAYCSPDYIKSLEIPKNLKRKIGVMINAGEFKDITSEKVFAKKLNELFKKKDFISFVRIACHVNEIKTFLKISNFLKKKKLDIYINLMQISEISENKIRYILNQIKKEKIKAFYIADSLGALHPNEIGNIITLIKKNSKFDVGVHTHNNKLMALPNSIQSIKIGATYIDSTVKGMGRGCGNTPTEYLIMEKNKKNLKNINIGLESLLNLIENYFDKLSRIYNWSDNVYYYLSGKFKIHPSYIQEILKNSNYTIKENLRIVNRLISEDSKKFNINKISNYKKNIPNVFKAQKFLKNKNVLICGNGESLNKIKPFFKNISKNKKMILFSINESNFKIKDVTEFLCICHPAKIMSKNLNLRNDRNIIVPSLGEAKFNIKKNYNKIFNYGIKISDKNIKINKDYCEIPAAIGLFYALCLANLGKSKLIYLAGIDGYQFGDPRNTIIENFLKKYERQNLIPIKSLTPSRFKIDTISPFRMDF